MITHTLPSTGEGMINPDLDIDTLAKEFQTDKRLMINNFMQQNIAQRMRNACMNDVPFSTHYVIDNMYQSKTPEELAKLNQQEAKAINNKVSSAAS